jgi:hypothetical protein
MGVFTVSHLQPLSPCAVTQRQTYFCLLFNRLPSPLITGQVLTSPWLPWKEERKHLISNSFYFVKDRSYQKCSAIHLRE